MAIIKILSYYDRGEYLPVGTKGIYHCGGERRVTKVAGNCNFWREDNGLFYEGDSGPIDIVFIPGFAEEDEVLW
jgi:hypothetical protein